MRFALASEEVGGSIVFASASGPSLATGSANPRACYLPHHRRRLSVVRPISLLTILPSGYLLVVCDSIGYPAWPTQGYRTEPISSEAGEIVPNAKRQWASC